MTAEFSPAAKEKYIRAHELYLAKKYDDAMALTDGLIADTGESLRPYLLRVYIYREQGEYNSLLKALDELVALGDKCKQTPTNNMIIAEAYSLLGSTYNDLGMSVEARQAFLKAADREDTADKRRIEISNAIFTSNNEITGSDIWQKLWACYRRDCAEIVRYERRFNNHDKIRLAYISADIRSHAVAWFLYPLLRCFDYEKFEVYVYVGNAPDEITAALQALPQLKWRDVREKTMRVIAEEIYADEIDVLIDLSGHTAGNFLPVIAHRPAAVQLSGIGYMGSTGLYEVDYFIGDIHLDGYDGLLTKENFTEKIFLLPHSHWCYGLLKPLPNFDCKPPSMNNGYITFGSFNNFAKVTDKMLALWGKILARVEGSRLLLKHSIFNSTDGCSMVKQRLTTAGISPERVEMRGLSQEYLSEYRDMDIALDTYPYTGGLTTAEALYMGVPVITRYGDTHGSRFGLSLLSNVGVAELAADCDESYVDIACTLAADEELLGVLHGNLRKFMHRSPLMDMEGYVRDFEQLLQKIYEGERQNCKANS